MTEAGMSPLNAIRTATLSATELLGDPQNLGALEAGKYADIVAVEGDPLQNIASLTRPTFVIQEGKVYLSN
jgi:imidazolonepropionase-like amidohydrolase